MSAEHEDGMWCWCRPRLADAMLGMIIFHRDLDPSVLAVRYMHGGEFSAPDDGTPAVPWWDE